MGVSHHMGASSVVLSATRATYLLVAGMFLPSLALFARNPVNLLDTQLFAVAPFWYMRGFWYGEHVTAFGVLPSFVMLLFGDPAVSLAALYFLSWLVLVVGLWNLRKRRTGTRIVEGAIILNLAPSLFWGWLLATQIFQYGMLAPGYPLPFPFLPLIGIYILRRWRVPVSSAVHGEIECPFCRNMFMTKPEGMPIGKTVRCPKCGKTLKVTG